MDNYAREHDEDVVVQVGFSRYEPVKARWFRFVETDEEMDRYYRQAEIIVAHGGAGTAITALALNKPLVIMPRMGKFDEHVDDQQLELSEALARAGLAEMVLDEADLPAAIALVKDKRACSNEHRASLTAHLKKRVAERAAHLRH